VANKNILIAFDGNWLLKRLYSVLDQSNPDVGVVLNAWFLNNICKDALAVKATHIVVAFDGAQGFRKDIYPRYKANRHEKERAAPAESVAPPINVYEYLPGLIDYLKDAGIAVIQLPKYEADDVLATCARLVETDSTLSKVYLAIKDKDSYQLLNDKVSIWLSDHKVDGKPHPIEFTAADAEKAKGVACGRMVDYQTILGDRVDNIIGINGIGPKKAAAIINEHATIQDWIDSLPAGPLRSQVIASAETLRLNRQLVTLVSNCCTLDLTTLKLVKVQGSWPSAYKLYVSWLYPTTKGLF
jgi:DNA polymerase I